MSILLGCFLAQLAAPVAIGAPAADSAVVRVQATSDFVIVDYGPHPAPHPGHSGHELAPALFRIPADGWLRGFSVELLDSAGNRLPNRLLHHMNVIAVQQRDLFTNEMMRIAAAGPETSEITLPRVLGVRVRRGDTLAMVVMLHATEEHVAGPVTVRLKGRFVTGSSRLRAFSVYPMSMAIGIRGESNVFDLPPGRSEHYWEGSPSVGGRILGLSGHLHRYGVLLRLEDLTARTLLWEARPKIGRDGEVLGLPVTSMLKSFGVSLRPDHMYRMTAVYENPTNDTIRADGMGVVAGVVMPKRGAVWPSVDRQHPDYVADSRAVLGARSVVQRD